jgi:acetyl coenzyme A synthetase (ADP forming)-like protein
MTKPLSEILSPSSVAVIGASRDPRKVGYAALRNIVNSNFQGTVVPVNPKADEILGLQCFPRISDYEGAIELAVVAIPAEEVAEVVDECGRRGVRGVVVMSAGFREEGPRGAERERMLLDVCRRYQMRLLGPNCFGVINTVHNFNASFAKRNPLRGKVAFISQSGALCAAILDWSLTEEVGFSSFVSLGNKADLDEADFIEALAEDEETSVILAYIEGVKDGERFMDVAMSATRKKPVVILKAGVTEAGAKAASSHTGAIAGSDVAYETAFRQSNVIRARSVEELFDLARALDSQDIPRGPNVAIVTNAGGPGILAADACERYGLHMVSLDANTIAVLGQSLPQAASLHNPVDVLGDAGAERYKFALENTISDPNVNSVLAILTPQAMTDPAEVAAAVVEVSKSHSDKPLVASFIGGEDVKEAHMILTRGGIPNFPYPERAVYSLKTMWDYSSYLKKPVEFQPPIVEVEKR